MFSITLICMGKLKERFYTEAAAEYAKRLRAYCDFQLIELPECRLPEDPNDTQIAQGLQKEAELIRAKLPKGCFFCVLTPEGKLLSSEQLADTLRQAKSGGRSSACFLIGSSFGIAPEVGIAVDETFATDHPMLGAAEKREGKVQLGGGAVRSPLDALQMA